MASSEKRGDKPALGKSPARGSTARRKIPLRSSHAKKSDDPRSRFSDEQWHEMVATAAYYRAEARGFTGGVVDEDWYGAEAALRHRLNATEGTSGGRKK